MSRFDIDETREQELLEVGREEVRRGRYRNLDLLSWSEGRRASCGKGQLA